ncbi:hypothetical protein GB928_025610 [Shinella curvata]|uniref:Uncharacterized protein n=1 Tax=Shinella curvata TaxID=1817964 RepID=A0ABT8XLG3_9HYPH|nr:hypothetical protein [Shinella curvata]MCJ8056966.1 hypothetical protein [Shinella curvata]MDO6124570.1 hypothetical protein [Shinella curvata]
MNSGIFEPSELAEMRDVFDEITSQPWFSRDPGAKKAFAKYLLDAYPGGTFNPATDKPMLEATARAHYGRDAG